MSKRRWIDNAGRNERPEGWCFACCLPGCRRMVALSGANGSPLAVCQPHAEQLPDKLFFDMEEAAGGAAFNLKQIEAALSMRVRIKKHFSGQAPRKRKRKNA